MEKENGRLNGNWAYVRVSRDSYLEECPGLGF